MKTDGKHRRPKMPSSTRLSATDWIEAAMSVLATDGIDGVRIDIIANRLKVTKGSFYWHFKNRADLLTQMIERWRTTASQEVQANVAASQSPESYLRSLMDLPFEIDVQDSTSQLALAMRLWARKDPNVGAAVAEVDGLRIRALARLFESSGTSEDEIAARSVLLYSYMRTALVLMDPSDKATREACKRILLGNAAKHQATLEKAN